MSKLNLNPVAQICCVSCFLRFHGLFLKLLAAISKMNHGNEGNNLILSYPLLQNHHYSNELHDSRTSWSNRLGAVLSNMIRRNWDAYFATVHQRGKRFWSNSGSCSKRIFHSFSRHQLVPRSKSQSNAKDQFGYSEKKPRNEPEIVKKKGSKACGIAQWNEIGC